MKRLEDWSSCIVKYQPLLLLAFLIPFLPRWPIAAGDTDLWYHLDGGRYILQHLCLPKDSYFSFLEPKREFVDYYWLFQVLVYGIFTLFGYTGHILLRAFLLLSLCLVIYVFLVEERPTPLFAILFSLLVLLLLPRFFLVRPHMFSYLFIALFLFVLERKREGLIFLPLLSLLWVNLHGIEYPVLVLILLCYLIETLWKKKGPHNVRFLTIILFCLLPILLNPNGLKLAPMPFVPTEFASLYINELRKPTISDLFSFQFVNLFPSPFTISNLILLLSILAAFSSAFERALRLSHLLLFFGGCLLLLRANRFIYESALLSLPLIRSYLMRLPSPSKIRPEFLLFFGVLLAIPFLFIRAYFSNLPPPPFSPFSLPEATCTFLKHVGGGGRVLNHPNLGGYMRFMLYPSYKIFMDMEVPFLFTNEDMHRAINVFTDRKVFQETMERYEPEFVFVDRRNRLFKEMVKEIEELRPVFFDETGVLYADKRKKAELVKAYELRCLDPFLEEIDVEEIKKRGIYKCFKAELLRLAAIYHDCPLKNSLLSQIYLKEGLYEKALFHAEELVKRQPHTAYPYLLKARVLKALRRYDLSERAFLEAAKRTKAKEGIVRELGLLCYEKGDYAKAYKLLKAVTDPFDPATSFIDLYYVASSALLSGRKRDAQILIRYGLQKLPPQDREWVSRYEELKMRLR